MKVAVLPEVVLRLLKWWRKLKRMSFSAIRFLNRYPGSVAIYRDFTAATG